MPELHLLSQNVDHFATQCQTEMKKTSKKSTIEEKESECVEDEII